MSGSLFFKKKISYRIINIIPCAVHCANRNPFFIRAIIRFPVPALSSFGSGRALTIEEPPCRWEDFITPRQRGLSAKSRLSVYPGSISHLENTAAPRGLTPASSFSGDSNPGKKRPREEQEKKTSE